MSDERRTRLVRASGGDVEQAVSIERILAAVELLPVPESGELPPALPPVEPEPLPPLRVVGPGRARRRRRLDEVAWALYLAAIVLLGLAVWVLAIVGVVAIFLGIRTLT